MPRAGLVCLLALPCAAQPLAEWVPLDGLADGLRLRIAHQVRSRCVPAVDEVAYPVYPGSRLVGIDWGRVRPACHARDGWSDLGGVALVSADQPAVVAEWYARELADHHAYRDGGGVLFVAAEIAAFIWARDYYKHANVALLPAPPEWSAAGYHTLIEFNRPAP